MNKTIASLLVLLVFLTGLAMDAGAETKPPRFTQADLAGTWNLTEEFDGRTIKGTMQISPSGELVRLVLGGDPSQPQKGRLTVSTNGRISGALSFIDPSTGGQVFVVTSTYDLRVVSRSKLTGTRLLAVAGWDPATNKPGPVVHEEEIPVTLTRPAKPQ